MIKEIKIPEIGENIESGDIVSVLVKVGDSVKIDQGIIELETDKAVVELPSPDKGTITEIKVKIGETVQIGQIIALIDTEAVAVQQEKTEVQQEDLIAQEPEEKSNEIEKTTEKIETEVKEEPQLQEEQPIIEGTVSASPAVRRLARELGIDISKVQSSGSSGRISPDDVKNYVKGVISKSTSDPGVKTTVDIPLPDFSKWGEIEREQMSKIRKITAKNMSYAWSTIPHVTQFDKADVTELETFRKKYAKHVADAGGKLTVTAMLLKVLAKALQLFPKFNASIDMTNNEIIYKKYYNIGIAVDTERGLLVPVIKDVDKKSITQLSVELKEIADKARSGKISIQELEGGTFTISNQGGIGGTDFTPIVYSPQVAIIGVSRGTIEAKYIDDEFQPRMILPLSLSYDHRIIDGADAARFLRWVVEALRNPLLLNF